MIKKISIFLTTILVALVGLFSVNPLKNTAEPQYFNKTIQNAVVETATNEYTFYLDNNINYYLNDFALDDFLEINNYETSDIIFYTIENEIFSLKELTNLLNINLELGSMSFLSTNNEIEKKNEFYIGNVNIYQADWLDNEWVFSIADEGSLGFIYRFDLIDFFLNVESLNFVNNELRPFIGNLTDFPQDTPTQENTPLDEITTIVNNIIAWFVNIFTGLADTFYNPTTNQLTIWGSVLFIGVAILLVSLCLKWLISLIKGI